MAVPMALLYQIYPPGSPLEPVIKLSLAQHFAAWPRIE